MPGFADPVIAHPGLLLAGLLIVGLAVLWTIRRIRRILGLLILCCAVLAILPGPRSAGQAAVSLGGFGQAVDCLGAAAQSPEIWRGKIDAGELGECRAPAKAPAQAKHRKPSR